MSGELVVLGADVGSVPYRAVTRLRDLGAGLPDFALVGGLAVIMRLGQAHRATTDVDAVSDDQEGLLAALVGDGLVREGDSIALDADLKLDVIDVSEGDGEYVPYVTHRFAFDTRTMVDVVVRPASGGSEVSGAVAVARPSALVAVKLGISEGVGRQRDPRKVGSDAYDVVRLLQRFGPDAIGDDLCAHAAAALIEQIHELARRHLVDDADRTAAAIVRSSVQGVQRMPADQIEFLGKALVRRLGGGT